MDRWPAVPRALAAAAVLALVVVVDDVLARRRAGRLGRDLRDVHAVLAGQQAHATALTRQLHDEARTDPLTGLGNRRQWQELLSHELDRARRTGDGLAVAVIDLDRFKAVNDRSGHAAGDALLRDVAAAFAGSVRSVDVLARLGGEEFGVALPDVALPQAMQIVERVRTSLPAAVTCSAGLAVWDGTESAAALQDRADAAMYRAKAAGRDRLVVD